MSEQKQALGRGLDALFGQNSDEFEINDFLKNKENSSNGVEYLSVAQIIPCSFQPRKTFDEESLKDLTVSVKEKGVLQPILVRYKKGIYEIIAGERRFRAALDAGLKQVPVIKKDLNDAEAFEIALIENMMRENLSPIEESKGFEKLINEYGYTHDNLSKSVGKSRSYITNSLRLLSLPLGVQSLVNDQKLSAGHARALIGMDNAEELAEKIVAKDLSVRQTESLISKIKESKKIKSDAKKPQNVSQLEKELSTFLGAKAEIKFDAKGKGKIILRYNNFSELENLLNKLEK